jgi:hypothetical protein
MQQQWLQLRARQQQLILQTCRKLMQLQLLQQRLLLLKWRQRQLQCQQQ